MADSDRLRQQRRRRHLAGDHSVCRDGCQARRQIPRRVEPVLAGSGENLDRAASLRWLAGQLQAAYEADPSNALLAKELRATLLALPPAGDAAAAAEWAAFQQEVASLSAPVWPGEGDEPG